MNSPVGRVGALVVGTVSSVSPAEIRATLDLDAPQATALNTGTPTPFPRINGYVLIPNETGAVVGLVGWIGVEPSPFPKRTGLRDFGLVDLPFPVRKMALTPVGTLVVKKGPSDGGYAYRLERGVFVFPSVGDPIHLPTIEQLRSIVEAEGADRRVPIGVAPLAANSVVSVDPDKMFGRHLAVLGNTGSGKSCTVAGLIRWSLSRAAKERNDKGRTGKPNARFIVLDPNGEYTKAFTDLGCRVFRVPPVTAGTGAKELLVPAWMWNSEEWSVFGMAAPGAQRPLLLQCLRELKAGRAIAEPVLSRVKRRFLAYRTRLERRVIDHTFAGFPHSGECGNGFMMIAQDADTYAGETTGDMVTALADLAEKARAAAEAKHWESTGRDGVHKEGFRDFSETNVRQVISCIESVLVLVPAAEKTTGPSEDAPAVFDVTQLPDHLEHLAGETGTAQMAGFISTLAMRIRLMLADRRLGPLVAPAAQPTLTEWLTAQIGAANADNGPVAVLDLSLIPSDVLHITVAVIGRLVFEAIQRHRKVSGEELPTVLVLEEAAQLRSTISKG